MAQSAAAARVDTLILLSCGPCQGPKSEALLERLHRMADRGPDWLTPPEDWAEKVYRPEIADNWGNLYNQPGLQPVGITAIDSQMKPQ